MKKEERELLELSKQVEDIILRRKRTLQTASKLKTVAALIKMSIKKL